MILKIKVHITHIYAHSAYTRTRARMNSCHAAAMEGHNQAAGNNRKRQDITQAGKL